MKGPIPGIDLPFAATNKVAKTMRVFRLVCRIMPNYDQLHYTNRCARDGDVIKWWWLLASRPARQSNTRWLFRCSNRRLYTKGYRLSPDLRPIPHYDLLCSHYTDPFPPKPRLSEESPGMPLARPYLKKMYVYTRF